MRSYVFLAGLLVLCAAACNAAGDNGQKPTKPNVGPSFKLLVASLNTLEKYRTMPGLSETEKARRDETVAKLVELHVKELTELVPNWETLFKAEERNGDGTQTRFIEFIIPVIQAVASGIGIFYKAIPAIISGVTMEPSKENMESIQLLVEVMKTLESYRWVPGLEQAERARRYKLAAKIVEILLKEVSVLMPGWREKFLEDVTEKLKRGGAQLRFLDLLIPIGQGVVAVKSPAIPHVITFFVALGNYIPNA